MVGLYVSCSDECFLLDMYVYLENIYWYKTLHVYLLVSLHVSDSFEVYSSNLYFHIP